MPQTCEGGCGRTLDTSELAGAAECCREDGYNSRGHRFGKFYAQLCCLCATKKGFDLTIANHGGCCQHCLQLNMKDLAVSHEHLHLDSLCAKLASMIYDAGNGGNSVRARLQGHFEILGENRLGGQQVMMTLFSFPPCAMAGLGPCEHALVALPRLSLPSSTLYHLPYRWPRLSGIFTANADTQLSGRRSCLHGAARSL